MACNTPQITTDNPPALEETCRDTQYFVRFVIPAAQGRVAMPGLSPFPCQSLMTVVFRSDPRMAFRKPPRTRGVRDRAAETPRRPPSWGRARMALVACPPLAPALMAMLPQDSPLDLARKMALAQGMPPPQRLTATVAGQAVVGPLGTWPLSPR